MPSKALPAKSASESQSPAHVSILKLATLTTIASLSMLVAGCENGEDRQIAEAQTCLDGAKTEADASICLDKVEGLESDASYLIRCSANFVAQGLTGERLSTAFQEMKDNPGAGDNPTTKMLAYMVFDNSLTRHTAAVTLENCRRSNVTSMFRMATTVQMATTLALIAGSGSVPAYLNPSDTTNFDPNQLKQVVDNLTTSATDEQKQEIGTIAQTANEAYCGEGSTFKDNDVCTRLEAAITAGNGDATAIGAELIRQLSQTN